jgi:hypothetical protein
MGRAREISKATSVNAESVVVKRDATGNFSAGAISANLVGNANTATALVSSRTFALSGDVSGTVGSDLTSGVTIATALAASGVSAGTYTKVTVDTKGRVTIGAALASADLPTYLGALATSQVTGALGFTPENAANRGQVNGYASLDGTGKVPAGQLPSYVDDVLEFGTLAGFPATGESGKIYTALDSNKIYRWSGSTYVEISASPGSTDVVPEGSTNLYFTTARARSSISAGGSLSYNASTGVVTYTQPTTVSTFTNDAGYLSGTVAITSGGTGATTAAAARTNLGLAIGSSVQAWDADLDAIAALSGTNGILRKTAANTWSLDTNTYLTGNQTITVSGDVTGSGTTAVTTTLATSGVTAGSYGSSTAIPAITVDAKGRITLASTSAVIAPAGTLTGSTLAATVTASSLTSVGTLVNLTVTNPIAGSVTGTAANVTGTIAIANGGTGATTAAGARTNLGVAIGSNVQAWDADLDSIAALAGTSGLLRKTAANTWSLDTASYLTGNQTITLSGDVTGSGTTAITATLATSGVSAGTYGSSTAIPAITVDAKGRVTAVSTTAVEAPAGTLTGSTLASTVTASNLSSLGVLTGLNNSGVLRTGDDHDNSYVLTVATSGFNATRALSLVGTNAVMKIARNGNDPGVDLVRFTGTTLNAYWDIALTSTALLFRERTSGTSVNRLSIEAGTGNVTLSGQVQLATGSTTIAPLRFTAGSNLTTEVAGALEWNGTNLFITQSAGPTRKTFAYTDSNITGSAPAGLLSGNTLAANVTASSLTSLGTLATLAVSGNARIGPTLSAWASEYRVAQVGARTSVIDGYGMTSLVNNWWEDSGYNQYYITNGFASHYLQMNGQHLWMTAPSGTAGSYVPDFTEVMRLDTSGRMGLGTTSPQERLHVIGNVRVSGNVGIRNVSYVWPSTQGAASTVLTNDGSGTLTWAAAAGGGGTSVTYGATPPANPTAGAQWAHPNTGSLYTYSGTFWVEL